MARKDNSPAISFFSFQDIITSVTGIMFLVMLLLTLLLLLRDVAGNSPERTAVDKLQNEVQELRARISQMTSGSDRIRERLVELEKLDAKSLPQRKDALLKRLEELQTEMSQMSIDEEKVRQKIEEIRQKIVENREVDAMLVPELQEIQKEVSALEAQKKALEEASEKSKHMLRFTWEGNIGKRPLLVECSGDRILVGESTSSKPQKVFQKRAGQEDTTLEADFLAWAERQSPSEIYFVFLVKPSAFGYAEDITTILHDKGYQRGREVLPNEQTHVFDLPGEGQKK